VLVVAGGSVGLTGLVPPAEHGVHPGQGLPPGLVGRDDARLELDLARLG
jgi:hypothetical protein